MLKGVLSKDIEEILSSKVGYGSINEIRIREGKPIVISCGMSKNFLSQSGLTKNFASAIIATKTMVEDIIFRASECSIYSVNEQIKKGYIVTKGGVRIGIAGTVIEEKGIIKTITNFSSINIRIPHEVKNCSLACYNDIVTKNSINVIRQSPIALPLHGLYLISFLSNILPPPIYIYNTICCTC